MFLAGKEFQDMETKKQKQISTTLSRLNYCKKLDIIKLNNLYEN